ncbi:hypothetical protein [Sinorhizobium sojae]|uniref:hypothetical protein n=1 Tax=Sinorhizobium sojae TaxID=716925 RepID=UPI0012FCE00A|nr:hypothetical protein [Sinorhizobium sojae]
MLDKQLLDRMYRECLSPGESPFGLWIRALFSVVAWLGADLPFSQQKDAFLVLLERLLREGKVVLTTPPCLDETEPGYWITSDGYSDREPPRSAERTDESEPNRFWVWDVPIERQIEYLRSAFPKDVTAADDSELNLFWYMEECPRIGWLHPETGVLYAS